MTRWGSRSGPGPFGPLARLQVAQAVGTLGDQMFLVVLSWVLISGGRAPALAAVLAVWSVARGACLLAGGVVVDRFSKRLLAIGAGILMAVVTAYLAALTAAHDLHLIPWLAAAAVLGIADGIRIPLPSSFVPFIVGPKGLARANRVVQTGMWLSRAIGPGVGGVLVSAVGPADTLWIIVAWYAATALSWSTMPADRPPEGQAPAPVLRSLREGIAFITRHRVLRWLLPVFAVDNFFVLGPVAVLIPVLVTEGLHGTATTLGLLNGAYGAGLVLGTMGLDRWPRAMRSSMRASLVMFAVADALFATLGMLRSPALAIAAYGLCGLCIGPASVLYRTYLMHITPPALMGRVSGATRFTTYGLQPFAQMFAGLVATLLPVGMLFGLAGGAGLLVDLLGCHVGQRTHPDLLSVPAEEAVVLRA